MSRLNSIVWGNASCPAACGAAWTPCIRIAAMSPRAASPEIRAVHFMLETRFIIQPL